jgi:predicted nucleic acid-binding protein
MRAIDTNVLVRLITRDNFRQAAAAEKFVEKGAWVSHLVLAEATWVLEAVYERKPHEIAVAVEMLLNHKHLSIHDSEVVAAALAKFRAKPSIGFSDCLLLETARKAGHLPLGTFDRDLAKFDGAERV